MKKTSLQIFIILALAVGAVFAQTTEFTYQGSLRDGTTPANANYDFEFALFDAASGGSQLGSTLTQNSVAVTNGIFTVNLDFGGSFPGSNRFLEIRVRQTGGGAFTNLTPRQSVTSAPYAVKSLTADSAANATNALNATNATNAATATNFTGNLAGDVTGTQGATVVTTVGGQSAANVGGAAQSVATATSNNTPNTLVRRDASGNFIAGTITGTLTGNASTATNAVNATNATTATTATNSTQLGGVAANQYVVTTDLRMIDARPPAAGSTNYIQNQNAGPQASSNFNISGTGTANILNATTQYNLGGARMLSAPGSENLFAGAGAGSANTLGYYNSFFGRGAGGSNTEGYFNSFFGRGAGNANTTGYFNSFFGQRAGRSNTEGYFNSFFGEGAGDRNTTGYFNSFFGRGAGFDNTEGYRNSFFGLDAGNANTIGSRNTIIGHDADVAAINLTNATAIGAGAIVSQSNSLVLGSNVNVGIGTTAPQQKLHVDGDEILSTGTLSGFKFRNRGSTSSADDWTWYSQGNIARFLRSGAGDLLSVKTNGNVGIGTNNPNTKLQVVGGSVYIAQPNSLIITSPNGACWFITVSNTGALSSFTVICP